MVLKKLLSKVERWLYPDVFDAIPLVLKLRENGWGPSLPRINIRLPELVNISDGILPYAMSRLSRYATTVESGVCELRNCVLPSGASYVNFEGNSLPDVFNYEINGLQHLSVLRGTQARTATFEIQGNVLLVGCSHHSNYYHWLFDNLTRLYLVASDSDHAADWTVLAPELDMLSSFQCSSLEMLSRKYPRVKILHRERFCEYRISRLWVPNFMSRERLFHPTELEFLRASFVDPSVCGNSGDRVYITRGNAGSRAISNEDELLRALLPRGFRLVDPGGMTFREQVDTFSRCSLVIGGHGAALSNIVFSQNVSVIELFGEWYSPCYFILASALGHHYVCSGTGAHDTSKKNSPMVADVRGISGYLDRLEC
jgi:capsular polysaccharide biosynthesis protein